MDLWIGTSGYSYKEWRGSFYPLKLPDAEMLKYYAEKLPAVEINNTFYRLPRAGILEGWAAQVPTTFRFVLKASRRITHNKRLKDAGDETAYLYETAGSLGRRLGVILFQMPPNFQKDLDRLQAFLSTLPPGKVAAFEFRHASWLDPDVFASLQARNCAWVVSDTDEDPAGDVVATANWGYLRLRKEKYSARALQKWQALVSSQGWESAYLFFKDEGDGAGPRHALKFLELANSA
jgi:uncharacterized protein YecE (DUF72 family)